MTYASQTQLQERFGAAMLAALADRATPPTGQADPAVLDRALSDADEVINGYVGARYALPLAPVPGLVVDLALAIAIYKLHTHEPDPKIKADHEAALRSLRDIADGRATLQAAGIAPASPASSGAMVTDRERPMTPETLKGFI